MKIVGLADIHGDVTALAGMAQALRSADLVLLAGDLTQFGHEEAATEILNAVTQYNGRVLAVRGNCDFPEVETCLAGRGASLDGRAVVIEGMGFVGVGGSLPCPGHTPNEISEQEFAAALEQAASEIPEGVPIVLLVHQPPFGAAADRVGGNRHVGSRSVRSFIERHKPLACLCGHIHEAVGVDAIDDCKIVNPGPLRAGRYAVISIAGQPPAAEVEVCGSAS